MVVGSRVCLGLEMKWDNDDVVVAAGETICGIDSTDDIFENNGGDVDMAESQGYWFKEVEVAGIYVWTKMVLIRMCGGYVLILFTQYHQLILNMA